MQHANRAGTFTGGVAVLFGTQVFGAVLGVINGILLARLLGPTGKGEYYLLILLPATAMVLLQLGLPRALGFFTARGRTAGIVTSAFVLTAALTLAAIVAVTALLPLLRGTFMDGIAVEQVLLAFTAFPLALNATFTTAIVMGRQAVRWYAGVNIAFSISATVLLVVILGGLGPSVSGAIAAYLAALSIQAAGFAAAAKRVTAANTGGERVSYRDLFRYGLPFYPGSLAGFFSYRVDVYLIAFLMTNASEQLGYYSMAVGLAEIALFFPRAVSTLVFPQVAGSTREESDRQIPSISRVTILVTGVTAILMVPAAAMMIWLILPAFVSALVPLLVLLPGVVTLSATFVVSGYMSGVGKPGVTSTVSLVSLAVNIVANLVLIPRYGIVGAALASLMSYSVGAFILSAVAARMARTPVIDFWVPRVGDVRYLVATLAALLQHAPDRPGSAADDN